MKKITWFKHDCYARFAVEIRILRQKYGSDSILYWDLLEELSDNDGVFQLSDVGILSADLPITNDRKKEIIDFMIDKLKLFEENGDGTIYCPGLYGLMEEGGNE